jgi:hypothetical protein
VFQIKGVIVEIRKIVVMKETVFGEIGRKSPRAVNRVAGIAVIENPCAGRHEEDLSHLFDIGVEIGELVMKEVMSLLDGKPVSYGKAGIVGTMGDVEHAAAILHPKMGKPIRSAVGGGESIIPSNAKVAATGTPIDIPLANKDDIWSFDEIDTLTVVVADAPRPNEILIAAAVSDGGRPYPRVGKGRAVT